MAPLLRFSVASGGGPGRHAARGRGQRQTRRAPEGLTARRRLDAELVRRGLTPSREHARARIADGKVLVAGAPADRPARLVRADEPIELLGPPPRFVSRGGLKLEAALDRFGVDVRGRHALDAGASTGGFTDCLLQRGAAGVTAVDVGYGQLHPRLRSDPRVSVLERTNVRTLCLERPADVVVADLSFISLRLAAPALVGPNAAVGAPVVVLVKPQFEAGRAEVSRGRGVVRDPHVWAGVLEDVRAALEGHGAAMIGAMVSPLTGADGNVEFLAYLQAHTGTPPEPRLDLTAVVAEAASLATG